MRKLLLILALLPFAAKAQHWDISANGGVVVNEAFGIYSHTYHITTFKEMNEHGTGYNYGFNVLRITSGSFYYGISVFASQLAFNEDFTGGYLGNTPVGIMKVISGNPMFRFQARGGKAFISNNHQFNLGLKVGVAYTDTKYKPPTDVKKVIVGESFTKFAAGINFNYTRYFGKIGTGIDLDPTYLNLKPGNYILVPVSLSIHYRIGYDGFRW